MAQWPSLAAPLSIGYCSNPSNFNCKPQVESRQQHLALYVDCHLCPLAIMIEVTTRHTECTHFHLDYSRLPAVALQCQQCPLKRLESILTTLMTHFDCYKFLWAHFTTSAQYPSSTTDKWMRLYPV